MNASAALSTHSATSERRGRQPAVPDQLENLLSFEQSVTLTAKSQFGWTLAFVRRPLFQDVEVVIQNPERTKYMSVEQDGSTKPFYNVRGGDFR
ncbi:MAG: hypothetical protein P8Q31_05150 [Luminiphilus sp.]|nr:hypothetical protein [Luminiphilus sp.]MDG1460892.1 hypothetical protein [Luminiphilus sp.]